MNISDEALIRSLRVCSTNHGCAGCVYDKDNRVFLCINDLLTLAADRIEKDGKPAAGGWRDG